MVCHAALVSCQSLETVRLELQGLMHSLKASAMKQASQKDLLREVLQEVRRGREGGRDRPTGWLAGWLRTGS